VASVLTRNHQTLIYALTAIMAVALGYAPTSIGIALSGILIALLGIPHGSLDLHLMSTRGQRLRELIVYLVCIALVLGIWLVQPTLMLMLFLINSAWHFGDCDVRTTSRLKPLLSLVYGACILLVLIDLRDPTIAWILQTLLGYPVDTSTIPDYGVIRMLASAMVIGTPMIGLQAPYQQTILRGLLIVGIAMLAPSLIAFTWYFVVMHSWTSMNALRHYIDEPHPWSWRKLIIAAAPLSILTFVGIGMGYVVFPDLNILAMLFIALSALTVPHSRLFHRVYVQRS
jgi:Brp/Blh family beta-carotene 15,15'-monooxygenase